MFGKASVPERKPFSLNVEKIIEDIESIKHSEEERNKLYYCLDEKPPQENKFTKLEDFMRGSNDLESVSENLEDLVDEVSKLTKDVRQTVIKIKEESNRILNQ